MEPPSTAIYCSRNVKRRRKLDGSVQGMFRVALCRSSLGKGERIRLQKEKELGFLRLSGDLRRDAKKELSDGDDQTTTMYKAEAEKKNKNRIGYSQRKRSESK